MKLLLVFVAVVAVALALPQGPSKDAQITAYSNDLDIDNYKFAFETSDGISRQEQGQLKNAGTENEAIDVQGSYQYTDPSGKLIKVTFVANENGYQPQVQARK